METQTKNTDVAEIPYNKKSTKKLKDFIHFSFIIHYALKKFIKFVVLFAFKNIFFHFFHLEFVNFFESNHEIICIGIDRLIQAST